MGLSLNYDPLIFLKKQNDQAVVSIKPIQEKRITFVGIGFYLQYPFLKVFGLNSGSIAFGARRIAIAR